MLLPGLLLTCLVALAAAAAAAVAILVWRRRRRRSLAKPSEMFTASRAEPQVADSAKLKTSEAVPPDAGAKPPFRKLGEPAPSSPVATPPLPETTTSPALVACPPQSEPSADQPPLGTPDRPHPPVEAAPSPRETPPQEPPPVPATSVEEPSSRGEDLPEKEAPTGSEPIEDRIECGDVPAFDGTEHLPLSNELLRAMPVEALPAPEVFPDGHAAPAAPSDQLPPAPVEPPEKVIRPAEPSPAPPRQQARHRDRRGSRRTVPARAQEARQPDRTSVSALRQAEAKLRLAIDSNRKSIRLSIVLARPEGFPDRIEPKAAGAEPVYAFDGDRYDDVDIDWTPGFLNAELRLADVEQQLEWLRSARPFHLFGPCRRRARPANRAGSCHWSRAHHHLSREQHYRGLCRRYRCGFSASQCASRMDGHSGRLGGPDGLCSHTFVPVSGRAAAPAARSGNTDRNPACRGAAYPKQHLCRRARSPHRD